jgi:hypothetical protein
VERDAHARAVPAGKKAAAAQARADGHGREIFRDRTERNGGEIAGNASFASPFALQRLMRELKVQRRNAGRRKRDRREPCRASTVTSLSAPLQRYDGTAGVSPPARRRRCGRRRQSRRGRCRRWHRRRRVEIAGALRRERLDFSSFIIGEGATIASASRR